MPADPTAVRLQRILRFYGERNKNARGDTAWALFEHLFLNRENLPPWPDWCYVPAGMAANNPSTIRPQYADVITALAAWRPGQGVYRFDPELLESLWTTPVTGQIPGEILLRLPEWCVYIEAPPGTRYSDAVIHGAFAHLDWHPVHRRRELRLALDLQLDDQPDAVNLVAVPVQLGGTLQEGLEAMAGQGRQIAREIETLGPDAPEHLTRYAGEYGSMLPSEEELLANQQFLMDAVQPFVSCLLYICSVTGEYQAPSKPAAVRTKKGLRMFPAERVRILDVGVRVGAQLRAARERAERERSGLRGKGEPMPPHLRRAHWATYWYGPKTGDVPQRPEAKWIPPLIVNDHVDGPKPIVIHPVRADQE